MGPRGVLHLVILAFAAIIQAWLISVVSETNALIEQYHLNMHKRPMIISWIVFAVILIAFSFRFYALWKTIGKGR